MVLFCLYRNAETGCQLFCDGQSVMTRKAGAYNSVFLGAEDHFRSARAKVQQTGFQMAGKTGHKLGLPMAGLGDMQGYSSHSLVSIGMLKIKLLLFSWRRRVERTRWVLAFSSMVR